MPFSADDEAMRKEMAEAHNPPLYTTQEAARVLERSPQGTMIFAKRLGWEVYHLPGPFHKANCYAQSQVDAAKVVLDEHGGRWPTAGKGSTGPSVSKLQKLAKARDDARLAANMRDFARRCKSFAEFSPGEQEAFVADLVDGDNAEPKLFGPRYDRPEFATATQRFVVPALRAQVLRCVDLYYSTTINFSHLRPDVTVRVIAELMATAPKPTTKRR